MSRIKLLPFLLLPLCLATHAKDSASQISVESYSKHRLDSARTDQTTRLAHQWGLEDEELERYRSLMQGPLGTYSPHLDPLSALGIEARTDAERQRYATLQVDAEAARVEKLLTYQRAYDQAWKDRFPNTALINLPPLSSPIAANAVQRMAIFVQYDCPECDSKVRQLQDSGATFDLYMVNSQQDDRRVRQWAHAVGIRSGKVRDGTITINHDNGRSATLGVLGELPVLLHKVDGKWLRK